MSRGFDDLCPLEKKRGLGYNKVASDNLSDLRCKLQALDGLNSAYKGLGGNNSAYSLLGRDVRKAIEEENY
ncbi:MAG: hypothetical protein GTO24_17625 [candidate division Zixibacteria bacterium]|nr:hypothetical protein [candidate division Zixibacteria bacterium]